MITLILIFSLLALCVFLLIIPGTYHFEKVPRYDKNGQDSAHYCNFTKRDKRRIKKDNKDKYIDTYHEFKYSGYKLAIVENDYGFDLDEPVTCIPFICGCFLLLASFICGLACGINHMYNRRQEIYTNYQVKIDNLKEESIIIDNYLTGDLVIDVKVDTSTYHVVVDRSFEIKEDITKYNRTVNELKAELYMREVRLSNPWTSWFWCDGSRFVEGYNRDAKVYTQILGSTLRTYDIKKV